jgi:2-C-methyl-D-erythritol 4-phosphate cytidylyltransferase
VTQTAAVVPAAGRGERLGPGAPKALRLLGGVPLLVHAVRALATARSVDLVVVAAPEDGVDDVVALLREHRLLDGEPGVAPAQVVAGGATRQDSVARALVSLPPEVDVVLVHDAARPLAPSSLVDAVASAVRAGADAVIPGVPVADTVKRVDAGGRVVETVDREHLRAAQTPQGFRRTSLAQAHAASDPDAPATDDAALVEAWGGTVVVVPGDEEAFKVTRPLDLVLAEAVLARRRAAGVVG